jgi:hypothetical protein
MGESRRAPQPKTAEEWRAFLAADPRFAVWRARVAAARPPLSQEQILILRPIFRPVLPLMTAAAVERDASPRT